MFSAVRTLSTPRLFIEIFLAAAVACCLFALPAARVQAAELTEQQIQAILGLLVSFDADSSVVAQTEGALRGTPVHTEPIPSPVASTSITLTAPNGGEKWALGVTNSVTWTPYGYNPDINPSKDVSAYLEKKNSDGTFSTIGRVEESGKASIHWITGDLNSQHGTFSQVPTGEYYIRIVNTVTGASDRSDKAFKITERPVDLKVNGSHGPVTLTNNEKITVKWSSTGGRTSCSLSGVREVVDGNNYIENVPPSGSRELFAAIYSNWTNVISVKCIVGPDGSEGVYDVVAVNVASGTVATLQVLNPNGGEQIVLDQENDLAAVYSQSGLTKVSIALYRNDQWMKWLSKDEPAGGEGKGGLYASISSADIKTGDIGKNIFKIYVTGQKADGSGYVDDKSDKTFSFVLSSTTIPSTTCTPPSFVLPPAGYSLALKPGQSAGQLFKTDQTAHFKLKGNAPVWVKLAGDAADTTQVVTIDPPATADGKKTFTVEATNACGKKESRTVVILLTKVPACTLKVDKNTYKLNDRVKVEWKSTDATSAAWVPDTSGKDAIAPPAGTPGTKGSAEVKATVIGNPFLTLSVSGDGGVATCSVLIPVEAPKEVSHSADYAGMMASVATAPYWILIDTLTDLLISAGVGQ